MAPWTHSATLVVVRLTPGSGGALSGGWWWVTVEVVLVPGRKLRFLITTSAAAI